MYHPDINFPIRPQSRNKNGTPVGLGTSVGGLRVCGGGLPPHPAINVNQDIVHHDSAIMVSAL